MTGASVGDALDVLLASAGSQDRDAALLAEMLPLADALAGSASPPDPARTRRVLRTAARWRYGTTSLPRLVGELHAAALGMPVAASGWRVGASAIRRSESGELVGAGAPPERIGELIDGLDRRVRAAVDPVAAAFDAYADIQVIHPFDDGNGRTGRLMLHLLLERAVGGAVPPVGLLLAAQGRAHEDALLGYDRGRPESWLAHVRACLERAATHAAGALHRAPTT